MVWAQQSENINWISTLGQAFGLDTRNKTTPNIWPECIVEPKTDLYELRLRWDAACREMGTKQAEPACERLHGQAEELQWEPIHQCFSKCDLQPALSASPRNLSEMQVHWALPRQNQYLRVEPSSLYFKKLYRYFWCTPKFENHCSDDRPGRICLFKRSTFMEI